MKIAKRSSGKARQDLGDVIISQQGLSSQHDQVWCDSTMPRRRSQV